MGTRGGLSEAELASWIFGVFFINGLITILFCWLYRQPLAFVLRLANRHRDFDCRRPGCPLRQAVVAPLTVEDRVVVAMPGGEAEVRLEADGSITLRGPSVHIADVEVPLLDAPPTSTERARLAVEA